MRPLLLSLKPRYADLVFSGLKTATPSERRSFGKMKRMPINEEASAECSKRVAA